MASCTPSSPQLALLICEEVNIPIIKPFNSIYNSKRFEFRIKLRIYISLAILVIAWPAGNCGRHYIAQACQGKYYKGEISYLAKELDILAIVNLDIALLL